MRRFILFVASLAAAVPLWLFAPAPASAASSCVYEVAPPYPANLWIRSGPGTQYDRVGAVGYGETVEGSCGGGRAWMRVWTGDSEGWAYGPYLEPVEYDY
ncbi:SH3 domain-containing protein [Nonomuraea sp. NPDC050394]|uniref:SH3 domain-containing protein n=1 Tax=Nonomuraea sp. NPDC050394 TaxID=3364363 RepID=UPI0037A8EB19